MLYKIKFKLDIFSLYIKQDLHDSCEQYYIYITRANKKNIYMNTVTESLISITADYIKRSNN